MDPTLAPRTVAIVGPTATGKTGLAVALAQRLGNAELINADSRQVLRGLRIGVDAPTAEQLAAIPWHLLGIAVPGEPFSLADWLTAARACLADLDRRGRRAIIVGGTGLYITALIDGFDLAAVAPDRVRRAEREALAAAPGGLAELATEIRRRDPAGAQTLDLRNPRRVVRALEILDLRGTTAAAGRASAGRDAVWIGVDMEPELHREVVAARAERIVAGGLMAEIEAALSAGVSRTALQAAGIGYMEGLAVRDGRSNATEAAAAISRRTLRYAKAQRTWFRRETRIHWIRQRRGDDLEAVLAEALTLVEG